MATPMAEDSNFEDDQLHAMSTEDIIRASRLLDNEIRIIKEELQRTNLELDSFKEKIKENQEKIKLNKQLPYLVGNIVEEEYCNMLNFQCQKQDVKNLQKEKMEVSEGLKGTASL